MIELDNEEMQDSMKGMINQLGGDLCKEICNLQELFLHEVAKFHKQVQGKLCILTQRVEDVRTEWTLYKRTLVSGLGCSNIYGKKI